MSILCLLRQVLSNNSEDTVRVRYLFTNIAFVIQISNHRAKIPFNPLFGQPMTIADVNDISPIQATLFRFSIFSILKANQRSMFSLEVKKGMCTLFYRHTFNNSHPNVVSVMDTLMNMQLQPITMRGGVWKRLEIRRSRVFFGLTHIDLRILF